MTNPITFLISFVLFNPHQQAGLHPHSQQNQNALHNQPSYSNPPNTNFPVSNQITTHVLVPETTLTSSSFKNNTRRLPPYPHPIYCPFLAPIYRRACDKFLNELLYYAPCFPLSKLPPWIVGAQVPIPEVSIRNNIPQTLDHFGSGTSSSEQTNPLYHPGVQQRQPPPTSQIGGARSSSSSSSLSPLPHFLPCYPDLETAQRPVTEPDTTLRLGISPDLPSTTLRIGERPELPSTQTTPLQSRMPATSSTSNDNTRTQNTSTSNIGQLNINVNHRFLINLPNNHTLKCLFI